MSVPLDDSCIYEGKVMAKWVTDIWLLKCNYTLPLKLYNEQQTLVDAGVCLEIY